MKPDPPTAPSGSEGPSASERTAASLAARAAQAQPPPAASLPSSRGPEAQGPPRPEHQVSPRPEHQVSPRSEHQVSPRSEHQSAPQELYLTALPSGSDSITSPPPVDLQTYLRVLWRRKWLFLAVVILVPVAAYLYSARGAKVYQASVLMEIQPPSDASVLTQSGVVATDQSGGLLNNQSVSIAARLIQTSGVALAAARHLSLPPSQADSLLGDITVTPDTTTGFITVTASAPSGQNAADIANAFGAAVNSVQAKQAVAHVNDAISGLVSQLGALPANARTERNQLTGQLQRLRALRAAQSGNAQIIEPASAPGAPSSPRPVRSTLLGLLIAVLLGLGLVALAERLDRRVRQPEDFEELTGLPVLSSVPRSAFNGGSQPPIVAEAFRSLRASLDFFNVDREVHSIVVAGGRKGDGKTLVSLGLARACALAGRDVILLDGDLRRPMIASRLSLSAAAGLAGVLTGRAELADELQDVPVRGREGSRLRVLAAGKSPANPSELLGSERMTRLLEELEPMCDLVIIDTSPLLAVSDALPLLDRTSGTLLVVRLGVTQRRDLRHLRKLLDAAEGTALGTVVTGASERGAYPNEYYLLDYQTTSGSLNGDAPTAPAGRGPLALLDRWRG